jgi:hypothetical protein
MRVTALVRSHAALLHSRPQERCGTKRQGHHAALQAPHARRHGCARWPVPIARGPLLHARSARGEEGGDMGAGDGGVGVAGPVVNATTNQRAATNPTPSLALPVAIQLDSTAQAIPATTLRITCVLSWAVLAQFVHGERRPTARVVADWRVGPRRGCRQIKAWRASPRGLRRGGRGLREGRSEGGREGGGRGGLGCAGKQTSCSGPTSEIAIVSPRLRWLLRPSCVSACLAPVLQRVRVPRVHQLLVTAIVPANMGQYSQRYRSI